MGGGEAGRKEAEQRVETEATSWLGGLHPMRALTPTPAQDCKAAAKTSDPVLLQHARSSLTPPELPQDKPPAIPTPQLQAKC